MTCVENSKKKPISELNLIEDPKGEIWIERSVDFSQANIMKAKPLRHCTIIYSELSSIQAQ